MNDHQIFQCRDCGVRFPVTNNALSGVEKCVMCGADVDVVCEYDNFQIHAEGENLQTPKASSLSNEGLHVEVILDNVRSAWNVGSMFRTADAAGVQKVHVCGIAPTPEHDKVGKTALGAEQVVPWEYHKNGVELVRRLKGDGYIVWAVEYTADSENLFTLLKDTLVIAPLQSDKCRLALVFGHEVGGVDPGILKLVDKVVHLPMVGTKNSMNVAVACGVVVYVCEHI